MQGRFKHSDISKGKIPTGQSLRESDRPWGMARIRSWDSHISLQSLK